MRPRIVLSLLLLSASVGCGVQTKAVAINPTAAPLRPIAPDSVRIFTSEAELDTLVFTRVAIIEASSSTATSQSGLIEAMREKASKLGANGVLLPSISEPAAGAKGTDALFGTGPDRRRSAVAIHITGRKTL